MTAAGDTKDSIVERLRSPTVICFIQKTCRHAYDYAAGKALRYEAAAEIEQLKLSYSNLLTTWAESRERHIAAESRLQTIEAETIERCAAFFEQNPDTMWRPEEVAAAIRQLSQEKAALANGGKDSHE